MVDRAIAWIEGATPRDLNFQRFRSTFMADKDLKDSLKFGHAVIETPDQLDQYLHTYGLMIESQWENAADRLGSIRQPELVVDYGCGQGLAGLLANDLTNGELFGAAREILLIEPSDPALARATAIYGRLVPSANVSGVTKRFDEVRDSDLPAAPDGSTLHIFSNALDVKGFSPLKLMAQTLRPGHHTIISVSHDRDFNGGTPQIQMVKAALENPAMASDLTIHQSTLDTFTCDNPIKSAGILWFCELEVKDG